MSKSGTGLIIAPGPNFKWLFDFTPLLDEGPALRITFTDLAFLVPTLNFQRLDHR